MDIENDQQPPPVFSFRSPKQNSNKLVNKHLPGLFISEKDNTLECRDS